MKKFFSLPRRALLLALLLPGAYRAAAQTPGVGIGTPTPTQALDVNGQLRVRGLSGTGTRLPTVRSDGTLGVSAAPVYGAAASQPALPTAVSGSVSVGNSAQRVAVSGTTAYVVNATDNTLQAFDVANPASPVLLSTIGTGNTPVNVAASGPTVYVAAAGSNLLQIFNMSTPASPVLLGSASTNFQPVGVAVSGPTAYVVNQSGGSLQTFDVSNPASPVLLGTILTGSGSFPRSVAVSGTTAYVVCSGIDALQTFDVSNPASPVLRGSIGTGDQPFDVAVRGTTAFVVNRLGSTLQAFGVANPASPVLLGSIGTGGGSGFPQSLAVGGTTAYVVSESSSTLDAFDVSNPASLVLRGSVSTGTSSFPRGVAVSSTAAYVVCSGSSTLRVFAFPGPPRAVAVNADGSLASVALPGGADFIQNQTAAVQAGGFNLSGNGAVGGTLLLNSADADKVYLTSAGAAGSKIGHASGWGVLNYAGPGTGSQGFHAWYTSGAGAYAERLRLTAAGSVGIGTAAPRGLLDVAGSGDSYLVSNTNNSGTQSLYLPGHIFLAPYNGTSGFSYVQARSSTAGANLGLIFRATNAGALFDALTLNANSTAVFAGPAFGPGFFNSSDWRFKQNIRPLAGALAAVRALRGVRYEWNALGVQRGGTAGAGQVGLIAQELEALYPELVFTDAAGYKSVNYAQLAPVLIEALKEQQQQLEALQARAAADHASLQTMQRQLARLLGEAAPAAAQARR